MKPFLLTSNISLTKKYLNRRYCVQFTKISSIFCGRSSTHISENNNIKGDDSKTTKEEKNKIICHGGYLSCHNVHAVFNGIPLFSEFSISSSDRLERCGELPFVSAQSTCEFDGKLCKKALETIGEPLDSSAIFR